MLVRRETTADHERVAEIHVAAFGQPLEASLLTELRGDAGWVPELSWVAEADGVVVGHVVATRGAVGEVEAVGLGPIGVDPASQAGGIGSALMYAVIGAADAMGFPLVALLGDPAYYSRFGFAVSTDLGVEAPEPEWGVHFQALRLGSWSPTVTGRFTYAAPFDDLA